MIIEEKQQKDKNMPKQLNLIELRQLPDFSYFLREYVGDSRVHTQPHWR